MLAIIQSRLNSSRLPSKALLPLGKFSILGYCVERVSKAKLVNEILIATSSEESDKDITDHCTANDYPFYCGSLDDVGLRLTNAALAKKQEKFIRICGDSPFIDPSIIDKAICISNSSDFDLVTNVFPRSFPKGQSVEIVKTNTMERICSSNRSNREKEHATSYIYNNCKQFRICSFTSGEDESQSRQCIDEESDYCIAKNIISSSDANDLSWKEIQKLWSKYA